METHLVALSACFVVIAVVVLCLLLFFFHIMKLSGCSLSGVLFAMHGCWALKEIRVRVPAPF